MLSPEKLGQWVITSMATSSRRHSSSTLTATPGRSPEPEPGPAANILYGVAAISDHMFGPSAPGKTRPASYTLAEHWDGSSWSVVATVDPGVSGNQFYAVWANASNDVYAVGQKAGTGFPSEALIEHWDGQLGASCPAHPLPVRRRCPLGLRQRPPCLRWWASKRRTRSPTRLTSRRARRMGCLFRPFQIAAAARTISSPWRWGPTARRGRSGGTSIRRLATMTLSYCGVKTASGPSSRTQASVERTAALQPSPSFRAAACGLSGVTGNAKGNYATLIEYHP